VIAPHDGLSQSDRTALAWVGGAAAPGTQMMLAWMIKAAYSDGQLSQQERDLIAGVGQRRGLASEQIDALISANAHGQLDAQHQPRNSKRETGSRPSRRSRWRMAR